MNKIEKGTKNDSQERYIHKYYEKPSWIFVPRVVLYTFIKDKDYYTLY